ncbi:MAG: fibronectin type III domain-containing protein [Acidobacteriota bacterium]
MLSARIIPRPSVSISVLLIAVLWAGVPVEAQLSIFRDGFDDGSVCSWSQATDGHVRCSAPRFPGIVSASATAPGTAALSWLPATDDRTPSGQIRYEIHADREPAFEPTAATRRATVTGALQAEVLGLTPGAVYELLVLAVDANGEKSVERDHRTLAMPSVETLLSGVPVRSMDALGLGALAGEDASSLTFRATASSILPAPGTLLVGQRRDLGFIGDLGYLRRVVSATRSGNQIVVRTEPARLDDAFAQAGLESTIKMLDLVGTTFSRTPDRPTAGAFEALRIPLGDGATHHRLSWGDGPLQLADQTDFVPRSEDGAYLLDVGPLHVELRFDYEPELRLGASWSAVDGLQSGEAVARGTLALDARASLTAAQTFRYHKGSYSPLLRRTWLFVHQVGPIPVIQRVVFNLSYTLDAFASAGLRASAAGSTEVLGQIGALYDPATDRWNDVSSIDVETEGRVSIDGVSALDMKVVLVPQFSVQTYELLTTRFSIGTGVGFDTRIAYTSSGIKLCGADLVVDVDCQLSADLSVFHREVEILPRTTVCGPFTWPIHTFDQPCGPDD